MQEIVRVSPDQVTYGFSKVLQQVGFDAWRHELFFSRNAKEIEHMFNPKNSVHVERAQAMYRRAAKRGSLVLAITQNGATEQFDGFAMAVNEVSGSPLARAYKRTLDRSRVYAKVEQVNVRPSQNEGTLAYELIDFALESFPPERDPADQEPKEKYNYFGEDHHPVQQLRLAGESVAVVRANIAKLLDS